MPRTGKDLIDWERFAGITELDVGSHRDIEAGMCALEAAGYVVGEPWSDHPRCVSPVIAGFVRVWNDVLPGGDRTRILLPLIPRIVGTVSDAGTERRRGMMVAEWFLRTYLPTWFRSFGMRALASRLEAVPLSPTEPLRVLARKVPSLTARGRHAEDTERCDPFLVVRFFFQGTLIDAVAQAVASAFQAEEVESWVSVCERYKVILIGMAWNDIEAEGNPKDGGVDRHMPVIGRSMAVTEALMQLGALELVERLILVDRPEGRIEQAPHQGTPSLAHVTDDEVGNLLDPVEA